jgi:hypothetical protein
MSTQNEDKEAAQQAAQQAALRYSSNYGSTQQAAQQAPAGGSTVIAAQRSVPTRQ